MPNTAENETEDKVSNGIAVGPNSAPSWLADAVRSGGGDVVPVENASALIWFAGPKAPAEVLEPVLQAAPHLSWVALSSAGVERYQSLIDDRRMWTGAKGIYGEACAEHALALLLSGRRRAAQYARKTEWSQGGGTTLFGAKVLVVGGGGIARAFIELIAPFRCEITVIRRTGEAMGDGIRVVTPEHLHASLRDVDVVLLAAALTDQTRAMFGQAEFAAMPPDAWLVNIARGGLVVTADLVEALDEGTISGAALDVTDPEPLPMGHPLWAQENCIITPHTANPVDLMLPLLFEHISGNVRRFLDHEPLEGLVDAEFGY